MDFLRLLDALPLWAVFIFSMLSIMLSAEIGHQIGRWDSERLQEKEKPSVGTVVGASLGLLAFMLAFTFGSVTSRYDNRKELVLNEANAIGTAYLRADMLEQPFKDDIKALLRSYVADRILMVQNPNKGQVQDTVARAEQLHAELWSLAVAVAAQAPTPITSLFVAALNDVIDVHQERVTVGRDYRLPAIFWAALFCLGFITMLMGGYAAGIGKERRSITDPSVAFAFSVVIVLVVTLDRPSTSSTLVNQSPLFDLQNSIGKPS